jgi:hypothetical protein
MRQAQSATTAAKSLLAQRGEIAQNDSNEAHDKEVICVNLLCQNDSETSFYRIF